MNFSFELSTNFIEMYLCLIDKRSLFSGIGILNNSEKHWMVVKINHREIW